jgi:hypothetical protein
MKQGDRGAGDHLINLLEGVSPARVPSVDGLAGDGGEPGGPAGGDLFPTRLVGEAAPEADIGVRRGGGRARRPRPALPLDLLRLLGRLRGRGSGSDPLLLRLGNSRGSGRVVLAAGGGDRGGAGGGRAAVHAAHGGWRSPAAGHGWGVGRRRSRRTPEKAPIRRRRRVGRGGGGDGGGGGE